MPDPGLPLAGEIWAARPKPLSALWSAKGGALPGAAAGLMVGGGPVGAAVGAAVGIALGAVAASAKRLNENMKLLEATTRRLIEQYKAYSPVIARLRNQWIVLERRLNRIWAQTIAPTLKRLTEIGTEFKERWTRIKVEVFQAIEPYLKRVLSILQKISRASLWMFEKLTKVLTDVIDGFTKLLRFLRLLPGEEERGRTQLLKPFSMDWPTVEGPLTGAMRRAGITGPPFTGEAARRSPETEEEEGETKWYENLIRGLITPSLPRPYPFHRSSEEKEKTGVNINVNVSDSKELSAAFERVWHRATYELRKIEAEDMYEAFVLQEEGTYT